MTVLTVQSTNGKNLTHDHRCSNCRRPDHDFFCNLAGQELRIFESLKITRNYPRGKILFVEGQPASGVYILCNGRVKLSTCSPVGKVIILNISEPGEVLGLSAVLAEIDYGVKSRDPPRRGPRAEKVCSKGVDFIKYLRQNPEAGLSAARQLANSCHRAQRMICSFGLSDSVIVKLAKLFVRWSRTRTVLTARSDSKTHSHMRIWLA